MRPQKRSLTEHRCPLPRKCPLLPGETVADTVATTPKAGHRGAPPRALKPGALRLFRQVHKQQPWHRTEFDIALRRAERKAELEPLLGGLRHPYRREWATERKSLPLPDVMAVGGWKDSQTLLTC